MKSDRFQHFSTRGSEKSLCLPLLLIEHTKHATTCKHMQTYEQIREHMQKLVGEAFRGTLRGVELLPIYISK